LCISLVYGRELVVDNAWNEQYKVWFSFVLGANAGTARQLGSDYCLSNPFQLTEHSSAG